MIRLEETTVRLLWSHLKKKYKLKFYKKEDSRLMKVVGWTLQKAGVMPKKAFIENYTTTIGHRIYFHKGFKRDYDVNDVCLLTHEISHVVQSIGLSYVTNSYKRARWETDAYKAENEIYHYLTGSTYTVGDLVRILKGYGLSKNDLDYARSKYETAEDMICRGHYVEPVSKEVIRFLSSKNQ